jgi:hypothetical protein
VVDTVYGKIENNVDCVNKTVGENQFQSMD